MNRFPWIFPALLIAGLQFLAPPVGAQIDPAHALHTQRTIDADVVRFQHSNTTLGDGRTLWFRTLIFQDAGGGELARIDFNNDVSQQYYGQHGANSALATGFWDTGADVWSRGLEAILHYPVPAATRKVVLECERPIVAMSTTVQINGVTVGVIDHHSLNDAAQVWTLDFAGPARFLEYEVEGAASAELTSLQFVNAANAPTFTQNGLAVAPNTPTNVDTSGFPVDLKVTVNATGVAPGAKIRVYLNRHQNENCLFERDLVEGSNEYTSAQTDAFLRYGDLRLNSPTDWSEDFRTLRQIRIVSDGTFVVENGVLTMNNPAGSAAFRLPNFEDRTVGEGGFRWLAVRLRVTEGANYYIRLLNSADVTHERQSSALENREGSGEWEYLLFDFNGYFKYETAKSTVMRKILFLLTTTNATMEIDYFRFSTTAPAPNPADVIANEAELTDDGPIYRIDGLDNDLDGDVDLGDSDFDSAFPRSVHAIYHLFFSSPHIGIGGGGWGGWAGTQLDMNMNPTGRVFNPDNCIGADAQQRRDIASKYWPLDYSMDTGVNTDYVPGVPENLIDFNTRAGLNYVANGYNCGEDWLVDYNAEVTHFNDALTCRRYGIDSILMSVGGSNPDLSFRTNMELMLRQMAKVNQQETGEFGVSGWYAPVMIPTPRTPEESVVDLSIIRHHYGGQDGFWYPFRRWLDQPRENSRVWNTTLIPILLEYTSLGDAHWDQADTLLERPLTAEYQGEIDLPFAPTGQRVDFQIECLNPYRQFDFQPWSGISFDYIRLLDGYMVPLPNESDKIRFIDLGVDPNDADSLTCVHECGGELFWTDSFTFSSGDTLREMVTPGLPNISHFSLWMDSVNGTEGPRFLQFRARPPNNQLGEVVLRYRDTETDQWVEIARWGAGGAFPEIPAGTSYSTHRLRYPGDPVDFASLYPAQPTGVFNSIELANDGNSGRDMIADGYAGYNPERLIDRRTWVNCPQIYQGATVRPGFEGVFILNPPFDKDRENGEFYTDYWDDVLKTDPTFVFISTYNEWQESTQIAPTVEYGFKYMQYTLTYSVIFRRELLTELLPSQSGLIFSRFDPRGYLDSNDKGNARVFAFQTRAGETLVFKNVFKSVNSDTVAAVTFDGAPYDQANWSRVGDDLQINTIDDVALHSYEITLSKPASVGDTEWFFADGGTLLNQQTFVTSLNSNSEVARLDFTLYFEDRPPVDINYRAGVQSRHTFAAHNELSQTFRPDHANFSIRLRSDLPVFAERVMYWESEGEAIFRFGASAALPTREAATEWFLAEGTTTTDKNGQTRDTFLQLLNPNSTDAQVEIEFQREGNTPIVAPLTVPAERRRSIRCSDSEYAPSANFALRVTSTNGVGVVVDRTMEGAAHDVERAWGHSTLALTESSTTWYFGDGASGGEANFETFVTLGNSDPVETAETQVRFLLADGPPVIKTVNVPPRERETVIAANYPELADKEYSIEIAVQNGGPAIVAERPIYWTSNPFTHRNGGSNTVGATQLSERWFLSEGAVNGQSRFICDFAIGNPNAQSANVTVQFFLSDGQIVSRDYVLAGERRLTVRAADELAAVYPDNRTISFSTVVSSTNGVSLIVDRSMYSTSLESQQSIPRMSGHASNAFPLTN